jgi:enoyl-CoA hydratase/carnithine racemase
LDPQAILRADLRGRLGVFQALGDLVEAFWFGGVPLVCDISGPAVAGGAVLAALADFAVIDAKAKICFSEVKVGLPLPGFIQRLIRSKVNAAAWNEVMLLGKNVDAAEALSIGFANAVYTTPSERDELLGGLVGRIGRVAPAVLAQTLKAARADDRRLFDAFRAEQGDFLEFLTDEYLGKGLAAIVRGESPRF